MQDRELKKLLLETCTVGPGQEDRAWRALREKLYPSRRPLWSLLFYPTWRGAAVGAVALLLVFVAGRFVTEAMTPPEFATAASQSPGIYATSFYSSPGKAQVVWLNGLEPASDKPTYLDPSTLETSQPNKPASTRDPNQL